ncbi:MAG: hypothetical protein JO095_04190 [Alphaproteobacteria bacterium]|nr:hypothetical protein [Alphaproteobacteria bacterium]MBV9816213.1 hypothetical protein [Alphaproteobacteria bacterium]
MNAVGLASTREILFTARQFSAHEAYEMGLVNRVVSKIELSAHVQSYAETIAANAPLTITAVKRITHELGKERGARDLSLCDALVADATPAKTTGRAAAPSWKSVGRSSAAGENHPGA